VPQTNKQTNKQKTSAVKHKTAGNYRIGRPNNDVKLVLGCFAVLI